MSHRPPSSTGDLNNNCEKLKSELIRSKYAGPIEVRQLKRGNPGDLLPLVHFALLGLSKFVQDDLKGKGYELFAKTDIRFLETTYKLLRNEFEYQPQLRVDQFFSDGFVERKIIFVHDVLKLCQMRHIELKRDSKPAKPGARPPSAASSQQVIRHHSAGAGSLSGSGNYAGSHAYGVENEERGMPRTAAPPAPTPTPVQPPPRAHAPSSILEARSSIPQPLVIDGGGYVRSAPPRGQGGVYGEIDDVEYDDDDGEGYGYGLAEEEECEEEEEEEEEYEDDELFADRRALARSSHQQQQVQYHHAGLSGCHNDELVLKMSETMIHIEGRQQLLESRMRSLEGEAAAQSRRAADAERVAEEAQARLTLAEGRLRMLEQRTNEIVADSVVARALSPAGGGARSPDLAPEVRNGRSTHSYQFGDAAGAGSARSAGEWDARLWQQPPTSSFPPKAAAEGGGVMRSKGSVGSSGGRGGVGELDSFIASISQRFRETNDLLSQSKASLTRRQDE